MLNVECGMLGAECWVRNAGCGVLGAECWVLGAECGMLDTEAHFIIHNSLGARGEGRNAEC